MTTPFPLRTFFSSSDFRHNLRCDGAAGAPISRLQAGPPALASSHEALISVGVENVGEAGAGCGWPDDSLALE
ncbi:unnamed protein product [Cuscuta epithymum]|uniref:Uncharacterized protein n=1 Tax=Cuscuta epithymum TaxID=186058 RepID=A0AAV0CN15_9ASTE|nr:unnamed protein product [Cuscuta epithymum]CAH9124466.1 unnamed protein product [Cuscuta epithymum]